MQLIHFVGLVVVAIFHNRVTGYINVRSTQVRKDILKASSFPDLERCLFREYTSFFSPMERNFYDKNVKFTDPLTRYGSAAHMANVSHGCD